MTVKLNQHIWRTTDGRLVEHGNDEAAFLAYPTGTEFSDEEARRLGVSAFLKSRGRPADKLGPRPADKALTHRTKETQ